MDQLCCFLVVVVNDGRFRAGRAQETNSFVQRHLFHQLFRGYRVAWVEHDAPGDGPHDGNVLQAHLRRTVLADTYANVRTRHFEVRP